MSDEKQVSKRKSGKHSQKEEKSATKTTKEPKTSETDL